MFLIYRMKEEVLIYMWNWTSKRFWLALFYSYFLGVLAYFCLLDTAMGLESSQLMTDGPSF